jgi:LuxR family maltose regulon positive regulatory protein
MKLSADISRISPPSLPQILSRTRLLSLLEKNKDKKLILILGQAAQGKTTLVASYVKTSKMPSAWMNLDKEDCNPLTLFQLIAQSLHYALKGVDSAHFPSYPPGRRQMRREIPLFREWSQSLFEDISWPVQIVMDGLERLVSNAPVFKLLQVLVEDAPPNIHLIMLSREIPSLPLEFQHLKMSQEALILTNEDLAFTQDEIKDFFKKIRGMALNTAQCEKIYLATEGWIGGLILLSESLSRFPEDVREKYISEDLAGHFKREIFQYFDKEIFSSQPKRIQKFLIKSSIIDLIEPAYIKDFIGTENTQEILREHVRKNLFVHSFYDDTKGWSFRYHQLFRSFLKAKFKSEIGDEEQRFLFLKAGYLYEQRDELENSVKFFLEARAYPQAVSAIERVGMDLLRRGRGGDLSRWILALPEDMIQGNPWLPFYLTITKRFIAGKENVVALQKAYTLFKEKGDMKGILISLAQLIETSILTGMHLVPLRSLIEQGEAILKPPVLDKYRYECGTLWCCLGLGLILGEGHIRKGIRACQDAHLIAEQFRDISLQAYALTYSALGLIFVGDFSLADETCRKIERLMEKGVYSEIHAIQLLVRCVLANYRGDFMKAQGLVEKLQMEMEKYGFVFLYPWIHEISGFLRLDRREFVEAEEIGNTYLSTALSLGNALLKGLALKLLGLIYFRQGDFKKAKTLVDGSINALSKEAPAKYELNRSKIIMGLVCLHLKEYKRAQKELSEALPYFSSISGYISLVETHFAIAILQKEQGKFDEAAMNIQAGFKIAEKKRYEYSCLLGTQYLARACLLALELRVEKAADYAAYLLSTRLSSMAEEELEKLSSHPDSWIRKTAWEIRRKIHRSRVPRLRIETLGRFRVFRGDFLLEEKEWHGTRSQALLKAIIAHGSRRVHEDLLIEDLWPEGEFDAEEMNFKVTLHRLRKTLEPTMDKNHGSSYIHLKENLVSLDEELCDVDVDKFLSLLKQGELKEKEGDTKTALISYESMMEQYRGEFLPEDIYPSWAQAKREELRGKYCRLLSKMAKIYERKGALTKAISCYQKAILVDPCLEEAYQQLMLLFSERGMGNRALRVYEECKKALRHSLEADPDELTVALYKKILEKSPSLEVC